MDKRDILIEQSVKFLRMMAKKQPSKLQGVLFRKARKLAKVEKMESQASKEMLRLFDKVKEYNKKSSAAYKNNPSLAKDYDKLASKYKNRAINMLRKVNAIMKLRIQVRNEYHDVLYIIRHFGGKPSFQGPLEKIEQQLAKAKAAAEIEKRGSSPLVRRIEPIERGPMGLM